LHQQHWRASAPINCSGSLPASVLPIDGFDQQSKPHDFGVFVGVGVTVGVRDGVGDTVGVRVRVGV
jgi:hypothetical protein